jgi:tetratricopeptide (TPR) repeat protein
LCYNDVFLFKEILIKKAVEEHIVWVRNSPTDQDSHSSLAEAYICLAGLYFDPLKPDLFKAAELKAIEELKILQEMSPHDTWALEQLALSYHALKNREEEVKTYEKLLHLKPANKEYLFHLGRLYFSLGLNAKGLKIYENLKKLDASKSDALIAHYGLN